MTGDRRILVICR